jgi:hypothetical protein
MIDFKIWLPQIIGYCEFVADEVKLRRAWINRDFSATSVTDFDELYEQVFDDLDADRFAADLDVLLPNSQRARAAISAFLASLKEVDRTRSKCPALLNAPALLDSVQWRQVRIAALAALDVVGHKVGER